MKSLLYSFILCCLFYGCSKNNPEYSDIPEVEFLSAQTSIDSSDKNIAFTFMLYDGDGNIGLNTTDTIAPFIDSFQQNFYAKTYAVIEGVPTELPYNLSYRIPILRENGQDKFIKAKVNIDFKFVKSIFIYDSVFFTYFVFDRNLNRSNIDTSSVIIF